MFSTSCGDSRRSSPQCACGWTKIKLLGRGAHGSVFLARLDGNQAEVAVKQVLIDGLGDRDMAGLIENEIIMNQSLCHPNIVRYLGTHNCGNCLNIILEYCAGGSLRQMLQADGALPEPRVAQYTQEILAGLVYLHDNGIAHRDVKGANVLVSEGGCMKLGDFGASKRLSHESVISGLKGTPHWMAPEIIKGQQTSQGWKKADVWSLGCTVVEMLSGKMPWPSYPNPIAAMYHIANGETPPLDVPVSSQARDFIAKCCTNDPAKRPSVRELLSHPFLQQATSGALPFPSPLAQLPTTPETPTTTAELPPVSPHSSCSTSTTMDCTYEACSFNSGNGTKPPSPCSSTLSVSDLCDPTTLESDMLATSFEDSSALGSLSYPEPAAVRRSCSTGTPLLQPSASTRPCVRRASFLQRQGSGPAAFPAPVPLSSSGGGGGFASRFAQAFQLPEDAMNSSTLSSSSNSASHPRSSSRAPPCCGNSHGRSHNSRRKGQNTHPPLAVGSPLLPCYAKFGNGGDITPRNVDHPLLADLDLSSSSVPPFTCLLDHPLSASSSPLDRTGGPLSFGESSDPTTPAGSMSLNMLPPPLPLERASSQGSCAAVRREALLQLETSSDLSTSCLSQSGLSQSGSGSGSKFDVLSILSSSSCSSSADRRLPRQQEPPTPTMPDRMSDGLPRSPPVLGRYRSASTGSLNGSLSGTPTRLPPLVREDSSGSMESTIHVTTGASGAKGGGKNSRSTHSAPPILTMSLLPRRAGERERRRKAGHAQSSHGWAMQMQMPMPGGESSSSFAYQGSSSSSSDFMMDTHPAALVERAAYRRHMEAQQAAAAQQRE